MPLHLKRCREARSFQISIIGYFCDTLKKINDRPLLFTQLIAKGIIWILNAFEGKYLGRHAEIYVNIKFLAVKGIGSKIKVWRLQGYGKLFTIRYSACWFDKSNLRLGPAIALLIGEGE